jgi:hypothetical protein
MKGLDKIKLATSLHPLRIIILGIWICIPLYNFTTIVWDTWRSNYLESGSINFENSIWLILFFAIDLVLILYILNDIFGYLLISVDDKQIEVISVCFIPFKKKVFKGESFPFLEVIHIEPRNAAYNLAQSLDIRAVNRLVLKTEDQEYKLVSDISVRRSKENILKVNRFLAKTTNQH